MNTFFIFNSVELENYMFTKEYCESMTLSHYCVHSFLFLIEVVQLFDQAFAHRGYDVGKVVSNLFIGDSYHDGDDGSNKSDDDIDATSSSVCDIRKEDIGPFNQTVVVGGNDENNCHTADSDFAFDKSSKDMASLFTNK